jgi:hypothetical protein
VYLQRDLSVDLRKLQQVKSWKKTGARYTPYVGYPPAMNLTDLNQWIKKTLPADKTIKNIKKQKFNFT